MVTKTNGNHATLLRLSNRVFTRKSLNT